MRSLARSACRIKSGRLRKARPAHLTGGNCAVWYCKPDAVQTARFSVLLARAFSQLGVDAAQELMRDFRDGSDVSS